MLVSSRSDRSLCGRIGYRADRASEYPQCISLRPRPTLRGRAQESEPITGRLVDDLLALATWEIYGTTQSNLWSIQSYFLPKPCLCVTVDPRFATSTGSQLTASITTFHFIGMVYRQPRNLCKFEKIREQALHKDIYRFFIWLEVVRLSNLARS